ncbi:MAG: ferritin-like domain-containing protein [Salinimicrobium sp.]
MRKPTVKVQPADDAQVDFTNSRRNFLKIGSLAVVGSGLLLACSSDDDMTNTPMEPGATFDLGSGDLGILNYAYALEQLEAAFYTNVLDGAYWQELMQKNAFP